MRRPARTSTVPLQIRDQGHPGRRRGQMVLMKRSRGPVRRTAGNVFHHHHRRRGRCVVPRFPSPFYNLPLCRCIDYFFDLWLRRCARFCWAFAYIEYEIVFLRRTFYFFVSDIWRSAIFSKVSRTRVYRDAPTNVSFIIAVVASIKLLCGVTNVSVSFIMAVLASIELLCGVV